jgi:lipoate-protein ligase A
MILWCDGGHDPAENMRRDVALLEAAATGAETVLRLFTFVPPGITLGRAQDPARELDLDRCRVAGLQWAVRPTGGRAIYHDEDWTYSLAAGLADPSWGGGLEAAYGKTSRLLVASLTRLGVPVARRAPPEAPQHRASPRRRATRSCSRAASWWAARSDGRRERCCSRGACCSVPRT